MRIWGKIFRENHLLRDTVVVLDGPERRTVKVFEGLRLVCAEFDLAVPVWLAETGKRVKAAVAQALRPSPAHRTELLTYRNITRSIFTGKMPKEIFTKYYNEIQKESGK